MKGGEIIVKKIINLLLILLVLLVATLVFFIFRSTAKAVVNEGWGTCVSTGSQCGTDNGTQSKTVYASFSGVCPNHYHYQNNGNWNQRCHRDSNASHSLPEHTSPTGTNCPEGYLKSGSGDDTVCSKTLTQSCHTGNVDYSACTPAGQCSTECGQEATRVPDGKGGFTSCDATPACEVDVCPNIEGMQTSIPDGYHLQSNNDEVNICVKDPEVTPTPTEVPCTQNCGNPPTFAGSTTEAPVCGDGSTINVVANPHVIRKGEEATVNFFITEGDSANIYYSVVGQPHWQYAVANIKPNGDNFVSYTIHGLDSNLGYDFGIQQKRGCGGGKTTAVVVDGPMEKLFPLSYWE